MSDYDKFRDDYGDEFVKRCEDVDRILGDWAETAYIGPSNCSVKASQGYIFIDAPDRARDVFERLNSAGKNAMITSEGEVYVLRTKREPQGLTAHI